jgi:hypothetical protein
MNRGSLFHNNELAACQSYLPWLAFCVTRQMRESITLPGGAQAYAVRRWAPAAGSRHVEREQEAGQGEALAFPPQLLGVDSTVAETCT